MSGGGMMGAVGSAAQPTGNQQSQGGFFGGMSNPTNTTTQSNMMGGNPSDQDFVRNLYGTIEGRASVGNQPNQIDQAGLNYWSNALSRGATRENVQNSFQQAASRNPGVANRIQNQELSQISGARPSSTGPQYYQPVYQGQYFNYQNPGYDMMGQVNNTFGGYGNQFSPYGGQFSPYGNQFGGGFGGGGGDMYYPMGGGMGGGYGGGPFGGGFGGGFGNQFGGSPFGGNFGGGSFAQNMYRNNALSNDIASFYNQSLNRAPDNAGMNFWMQSANSGSPMGSVQQAIANSPEAQNRQQQAQNRQNQGAVTNYYNQYLRRAPEQSGLNYWTNSLNNGQSFNNVEQGFLQSPEYQNSVFGNTYMYAEGGEIDAEETSNTARLIKK